MNDALVVGNGSYIVWLSVRDLHGPTIVVVPDADIVHFVLKSNDDFIKKLFKTALSWVMTQMSRVVSAKKDELFNKLPGSVIAYEPKFIRVQMLNRVNDASLVQSWCTKFNEVLIDQLANRENHYTINMYATMLDVNLYDRSNRLNGRGMVTFWTKLDNQIDKFDKQKITLKPFVHRRQKNQNWKRQRDANPNKSFRDHRGSRHHIHGHDHDNEHRAPDSEDVERDFGDEF